MPKKEIVLTICGEEMRIRCDETEEYIKSVAEYVELKANEPLKAQKPISTGMSLHTRLVYAALNITDEMFKTMDELNETKLELQSLKKEFQEYIDTFKSN